jgi:hypothetical protein
MRRSIVLVVRRWLVIPVAVASAVAVQGCGDGGVSDPNSALISVSLRTDAGESAGRNQVLVTRADGSTGVIKTSANGTGEITLPGAGTYMLKVLPRSEFVYSDQLESTVTVDERERVTVRFTLYRLAGPISYTPANVSFDH